MSKPICSATARATDGGSVYDVPLTTAMRHAAQYHWHATPERIEAALALLAAADRIVTSGPADGTVEVGKAVRFRNVDDLWAFLAALPVHPAAEGQP